MAKRPPAGRCVHCLNHFDELTWDHVFPEAWYPETTPANLDKWKIPACFHCNQAHAKSESDLLVRLGLCIDPDDPKSAGIVERALRAVSPTEGKSDRDASAREALRQRILRQSFEGDDIPYQAVYPGFGPQPGLHDEERVAISISAVSVRRLVEKVVRGITYLESDQYVEEPYSVEHYVLTDEDASPIRELLHRFGTVYERGPGICVVRAVVPDDGIAALYSIEIWGRLKAYAVLSRSRNEGAA